MLFRRSASLVEAVHLDGTEASLAAVLAMPWTTMAATRAGEVEVATSCGRRIARHGSWITRDIATRAVRLYEDGSFQAQHEAVR